MSGYRMFAYPALLALMLGSAAGATTAVATKVSASQRQPHTRHSRQWVPSAGHPTVAAAHPMPSMAHGTARLGGPRVSGAAAIGGPASARSPQARGAVAIDGRLVRHVPR